MDKDNHAQMGTLGPSAPYRPRAHAVARNGIGDVSSLAANHPGITPLWFGEGDRPTPAFICDAAKRALDEGRTFYAPARGLVPLREAIARWTKRVQGIDVPIERITVPGSAMMAIMVTLQMLAEPGRSVVIVTPVWPNIVNGVKLMGASPRFVPLEPDIRSGRWHLDMERLKNACDHSTAAIFVCSPGNPSGWIIPPQDQQDLAAFARKHRIALISDEVYAPIVLEQPATSLAALAEPDDPFFVIHSFSKAWAMTGWRIGWMVHPQDWGLRLAELSNINNTGATTFAQYGAIAALDLGDTYLEEMGAICRKGRDTVATSLHGLNRLRWIEPEGAFYAYVHVEGLTNSLAFARRLALEARVGVAPGSAFGPPDDGANEAWLRLCFAQQPDRLSHAIKTIEAAAKAWIP